LINFALLEAVVAGLWAEHSRNRWTIRIAIASVVISIAAFSVAAYATFVTCGLRMAGRRARFAEIRGSHPHESAEMAHIAASAT
jgi:hypothetical protein